MEIICARINRCVGGRLAQLAEKFLRDTKTSPSGAAIGRKRFATRWFSRKPQTIHEHQESLELDSDNVPTGRFLQTTTNSTPKQNRKQKFDKRKKNVERDANRALLIKREERNRNRNRTNTSAGKAPADEASDDGSEQSLL